VGWSRDNTAKTKLNKQDMLQVPVESKVVSDIIARATRDTRVRSYYASGFHLCRSAFDYFLKMHISLNQLIKPPAKSVHSLENKQANKKHQNPPRLLTIFSRYIHCRQCTFILSAGQQGVNKELDKANLTST